MSAAGMEVSWNLQAVPYGGRFVSSKGEPVQLLKDVMQLSNMVGQSRLDRDTFYEWQFRIEFMRLAGYKLEDISMSYLMGEVGLNRNKVEGLFGLLTSVPNDGRMAFARRVMAWLYRDTQSVFKVGVGSE